ncbi:hypothetical protein [Azospirillum sp. B506]|uniref:hypothetical protein n=1 Tax=Azospirillum sp. B506 TaxID=137721 RepID=UPI0003468CB4
MTATHPVSPPAVSLPQSKPSWPVEKIAVLDLHKSFGSIEVLKGISFTANQGDVIPSSARPDRGNRPCCAA